MPARASVCVVIFDLWDVRPMQVFAIGIRGFRQPTIKEAARPAFAPRPRSAVARDDAGVAVVGVLADRCEATVVAVVRDQPSWHTERRCGVASAGTTGVET